MTTLKKVELLKDEEEIVHLVVITSRTQLRLFPMKSVPGFFLVLCLLFRAVLFDLRVLLSSLLFFWSAALMHIDIVISTDDFFFSCTHDAISRMDLSS